MSILNSKFTRRDVVKASGVLGAAAALYGCSNGSGDTYYVGVSEEPNLMPPVIDEATMIGSVPHNCGGSCIIKAYVKNGVIKRFTTDELPEKSLLDSIAGDDVEERACPRCRAQKAWIYSSNRLCYPLVQTGNRGDISTFKRVTWTEAAAYYKAKVEKIRTNWGPAAFYKLYGTGAGGTMGAASMFTYAGAGQFKTRQDYSFPSWAHTLSLMSDFGYPPNANSIQDAVNSNVLVLWSYNLGESFWFPQITWYVKQIQELGVKVINIDQRYSQTAVAASDEFIAPVQGTDTALIMAIFHAMLTDYRAELRALYSATDDDDLRRKVGKYLYGFFDSNISDVDATNTSYIANNMAVGAARSAYEASFADIYNVAAGMSLSAYVMGGIKTDPSNLGPSIYPDNIGYNVRTYQIGGENDPLLGKYTKCYGQVEKTPEWAEAITGVPAATIRNLAYTFLTKKVTCLGGGGFQRNSEGEQTVWAWEVLMNLTLSFGRPGRSHGWTINKGSAPSAPSAWSSGVTASAFNALVPDSFTVAQGGYLKNDKSGGDFAQNLGDTSKLTFTSNTNSNYGLDSIPIFTWLDAVEATNSAKITENSVSVYPSRWNVGQVKMLPAPIKMLYQEMGNILINQNGDSNHAVKVLTSTNAINVDDAAVTGLTGVTMNPNGYTVEFICVMDCVMTPSTRYADLILPGTMGFERYQTQSQFWRGGDKLVLTPQAVTPPGDALWEPEIGAKMADAFGVKTQYLNGLTDSGTKSFGEQVFEKTFANNPGGNTFAWWKKNGMVKNTPNVIGIANLIALPNFYNNPGSAAPAGNSGNAYFYGNSSTYTRKTVSGRTEAFCAAMMENYEARLYNNIDTNFTLPNGGAIKTAGTSPAERSYYRYVYPIPMYIPLIEGRHADGSEPDPLEINTTYPISLYTWHIMYRSHSTFNSNPILNELKYYKRNAKGGTAFIERDLTNADAGETNDPADTSTNAPLVWEDGVYETIWINPITAVNYDVSEGDIIYVESLRGIVKVSVHLSKRIRQDTIMIGQGSWYDPVTENGKIVDRGGSANTLMNLRPSRIGQGMTLASDCRVKIYKTLA